MWKLLRVSSSVKKKIIQHVQNYGVWTDWRGQDPWQRQLTQLHQEWLMESNREQAEMYVPEQDEVSNPHFQVNSRLPSREVDESYQTDPFQLNRCMGRVMV